MRVQVLGGYAAVTHVATKSAKVSSKTLGLVGIRADELVRVGYPKFKIFKPDYLFHFWLGGEVIVATNKQIRKSKRK